MTSISAHGPHCSVFLYVATYNSMQSPTGFPPRAGPSLLLLCGAVGSNHTKRGRRHRPLTKVGTQQQSQPTRTDAFARFSGFALDEETPAAGESSRLFVVIVIIRIAWKRQRPEPHAREVRHQSHQRTSRPRIISSETVTPRCTTTFGRELWFVGTSKVHYAAVRSMYQRKQVDLAATSYAVPTTVPCNDNVCSAQPDLPST